MTMTIDEAKELVLQVDHEQRVLKRWIRIKSKGYEWIHLQDEDVMNVVSQVTGISKKDMRSKNRQSEIVFARNIAMYILNVRMRRTATSSATRVNRNHSTCIYGVKVVKDCIDIFRKHGLDNGDLIANLCECEELLSIRPTV